MKQNKRTKNIKSGYFIAKNIVETTRIIVYEPAGVNRMVNAAKLKKNKHL